MINLDDANQIKKLDQANMLGSIEELYLQCQQTWEEISGINVPSDYSDIKNVIVAGMGGSTLGPHVVQSIYLPELNIPLQILNDYHLPGYVNEQTLVLLSSNSGTTEEVLSVAEEAWESKAKIMGMTSGGQLAGFLKEKHLPAYIFEQKHNPSRQPRMGTGYMILGMLGLFYRAGLISVNDSEVKTIIARLKERNGVWGMVSPINQNLAKQFAQSCHGRIVVSVSSNFLMGNVHTFSNQLNENAKNFSLYFAVPELNHHLMEGLGFPKSNSENLIFIFFKSDLFDQRIKKRFALTEEVVRKNAIQVLEFIPEGDSKLVQSFETLLFSSYVGFYLAMLNNLNPSLIPWVDYFKRELART